MRKNIFNNCILIAVCCGITCNLEHDDILCNLTFTVYATQCLIYNALYVFFFFILTKACQNRDKKVRNYLASHNQKFWVLVKFSRPSFFEKLIIDVKTIITHLYFLPVALLLSTYYIFTVHQLAPYKRSVFLHTAENQYSIMNNYKTNLRLYRVRSAMNQQC